MIFSKSQLSRSHVALFFFEDMMFSFHCWSQFISLLIVTARPHGRQDVGYRTISRPLVDALRQAGIRVNIHILRPGTYEALSRHLEKKKAGHYHVIHFDMHGSLMTYEKLQQRTQNSP